jgi:hypothetical protein
MIATEFGRTMENTPCPHSRKRKKQSNAPQILTKSSFPFGLKLVHSHQAQEKKD